MITIKNPITYIAFIDRFLISAESFRIPTTILINKIDLYSENEMKKANEIASMYKNIGYETHLINAENYETFSFLKDEINAKQVIISGNSGVGKSTLTNGLDKSLKIKISKISESHKQGKHTTTFSEMYKLTSGGYIIDTPGIKSFGIVELEKEHISHYLPEFRKLLNKCKYHNCKHINEPECAVKNAVENKEIYQSRYQTYFQLMNENQNEIYRKNEYQ
jgi:ribosome biogenesis GTPase